MVPVCSVAVAVSGSVGERRSAISRFRGTPRAAGMVVEATDAPSRNDGSETFTVATWNIRCGRNGGLESALRALESLEVDIAILTEAKLTKGIYTRGGRGYQVLATDAASAHQGGVALCHRQSDHFEVEETRTHGPNVISFHLMTGDTRYYVVGAYVPPSDLGTLDHIRDAMKQCPAGSSPILLGDLNINLRHPKDERQENIAEECGDMGVEDMSRHYRQRCRRKMQGRWTWRMRREGRWLSSQPDYFLARAGDRMNFKGLLVRSPRHHDSDHRAVVATFYTGSRRRMAGYKRCRCRFPLRMQKTGSRTHSEQIFEDLKRTCEPPPPRQCRENNWIQPATWAMVDARAEIGRAHV